MPIYAYKCDSCGFAKDVLQKLADAQLSDCPSCGAATFKKQLTAAGFQLKGSGWYVTDFKGGNAPAAAGEDKSSDAAVPVDSKAAPKAEAKTGSTAAEPVAAKKSEPSAGAAAKPAANPGAGTGSAG